MNVRETIVWASAYAAALNFSSPNEELGATYQDYADEAVRQFRESSKRLNEESEKETA